MSKVENGIDLSDPETRKLFDPDERLSDEEVRERVERFQAERAKTTSNREVKARIGTDPVSGDLRSLNPGEGLNDRGEILLLDPAKAAASADAIRNADPATVRQGMRRSAALQQLINGLFIREEPGPSVVYLSLERCRALHEEYQQAKREGYKDSQLDFLPLSAYVNKILPEGRTPLRHLMKNEFGTFQMATNPGSPLAGRIVCVADKDANG